MSETWYVLDDGSVADPRDVRVEGVLRHKDGRAVAYAPHGPRSRMMTAEEVAAYRTTAMMAGTMSLNDAREAAGVKPVAGPKRAYRTRAMKAAD